MKAKFSTMSLNQFLPGYVYRAPRWVDEVPFLYKPGAANSDYIPLHQHALDRLLPGFVYRAPRYEDEVPTLFSIEEGLLVHLF